MDATPVEPDGTALDAPATIRPEGREAVTAAVIAVAQELFAAQGPSRVSLREIARRAGVNHGLVYRYFGTREQVLSAVFASAQADASDVVAGTATVQDAIDTYKVRRQEGETYAQMLALALMDGADPAAFHGRSAAFRELAERLATEVRAGQHDRTTHPAADPRLVIAAAMVMFLGWNIFQDWLVIAAGLDTRDPDEVYEEFTGLIAYLLTAAGDA